MNLILENVQYQMLYGNTMESKITLRGWGDDMPATESVMDYLGQYLSPQNVVIKCAHCGQWGVRFCECRKCGAPIE